MTRRPAGDTVTAGARAVRLDVEGVVLDGDLVIPAEARGVVVFAHGSGSGRHSPRNQMVAGALHERAFATLLLDLLTAEEERVDAQTGHLRFDVELLAGRLAGAARWLADDTDAGALPVGYFGASTGAAAALIAAAADPAVRAVVSRGGRPDLAGDRLRRVVAPTLLIVGGRDEVVLDLNELAYEQLGGTRCIEVVPGATHLFEEPNALEQVADLAGDWFGAYLPTASPVGGQ